MVTRQSKRGVGEKVFQVETILARRELDWRVEYLLKWKGCSDKENTWEPESNLNCPDLLSKFNQQKREMDVDEPSNVDAEQILGAARMNSEVFYLVKLKGVTLAEFVPSRVASRRYPKLIIDFYEQRMTNLR
uniref:Chromo domain-containing protein n=1 Tax=Globodera rostochiensis TaxID=31243 RepID=A0A914IGC0_GLORO